MRSGGDLRVSGVVRKHGLNSIIRASGSSERVPPECPLHVPRPRCHPVLRPSVPRPLHPVSPSTQHRLQRERVITNASVPLSPLLPASTASHPSLLPSRYRLQREKVTNEIFLVLPPECPPSPCLTPFPTFPLHTGSSVRRSPT